MKMENFPKPYQDTDNNCTFLRYNNETRMQRAEQGNHPSAAGPLKGKTVQS